MCVALKPEEEAPNPLFLPAPCWGDSTLKVTLAQSWSLEDSSELEVTKTGGNCGISLPWKDGG